MAESRRPDQVGEQLKDVAQGRESSELVFDPATGQLVVTNSPDPDGVVATDIAASGYFE
jgi:hypothetical protein